MSKPSPSLRSAHKLAYLKVCLACCALGASDLAHSCEFLIPTVNPKKRPKLKS